MSQPSGGSKADDNTGPNFQLKPIGVIHTPFRKSTGVPIQPRLGHNAEGTVEIIPAYREALRDLSGFDRIWLIYWFDRARSPRLRVVPYLDTHAHGLFATRAPSRPNPIGMSPVRLLAVEGCILRIAGVDILDGTPLVDIKPYSPQFDCFPDSKSGWLDAVAREYQEADGRFEKP